MPRGGRIGRSPEENKEVASEETRCKCNGSWLVVKASGGANRPIYGSRNEKASRDEVRSERASERERERERNERFISRKRENLGISLLPLFHPSPLPSSLRLASLPYYHRPPTTCIINGGLRVQWDEKQPWVILPRKILLALTCTAVETSAGASSSVFSYLLGLSSSYPTYVPFPMPFDPTFRLSESIAVCIYSSIVIQAYTYTHIYMYIDDRG